MLASPATSAVREFLLLVTLALCLTQVPELEKAEVSKPSRIHCHPQITEECIGVRFSHGAEKYFRRQLTAFRVRSELRVGCEPRVRSSHVTNLYRPISGESKWSAILPRC